MGAIGDQFVILWAHALLFPPVALPVQDPVHVALAFLIFELSWVWLVDDPAMQAALALRLLLGHMRCCPDLWGNDKNHQKQKHNLSVLQYIFPTLVVRILIAKFVVHETSNFKAQRFLPHLCSYICLFKWPIINSSVRTTSLHYPLFVMVCNCLIWQPRIYH